MEDAPTFSCNACLVAFSDHEAMKVHYKTDWHIYNSRRRVAGLVPVTQEIWDQKWQEMANAKENEKGTSHKKEKEEKKVEKHHKVFEPWKLGDSLFDNENFATVDQSLLYMRKQFTFSIPEEKYCVDRDGLLTYLAAKIWEGHQCIYCNKAFGSFAACRNHMLDQNHTRIGLDSEEMMEEIEDYYDFSNSYQEMPAYLSRGKKRRQPKSEATGEPGSTGSEGVDDDEWEDVSEDDGAHGFDVDDDVEVIECNDESEFSEVMKKLGLQPAQITPDGDLKLPDGKVVVHRSVAHIYKQRGLAGRAAKAERMHEVNMRQMEEAGETPTTLVKAGHRPTTLAERYALKRQNPFAKVASRAGKRDQKAIIAVLKRQQRDTYNLAIKGAMKGPKFKLRMDQNMPHMMKG